MEYQPIFEQYVYILENIIESKIKSDGFQDDEIEGFYKSIQENLKLYEDEDKQAMDVLFSFTDFLKFKKAILDFKASLSQDVASI